MHLLLNALLLEIVYNYNSKLKTTLIFFVVFAFFQGTDTLTRKKMLPAKNLIACCLCMTVELAI